MYIDTDKVEALVRSTKAIIADRTAAADVTVKVLADFVTRTDFRVQEYLNRELAALYPEVQMLGEEGTRHEIDRTRPVWILDPIDGTTNLIHDYHQSAVSLGYAENGEVIAGFVYNPFSEEMFTARKGAGAYLNGKQIHVSRAETLEDALVAVGTSPYNKELAEGTFELCKRIFEKTQDIRRTGSSAIDLCSIAAGRIDGYFERNLKPWDFAAGMLIVSEAGGVVTNYSGGRIDIFRNSDVLAGTSGVHTKLKDEV